MSKPPDDQGRRLPSGRHGLPPELVTQYQRQRLLEATIEIAGERGYEAMAVAPILKAAGVSRATFYELFDDKLGCFLAAYEMAIDSLVADVAKICDGEGNWQERVQSALAAVLARLAADPELARVALVEISVAGPVGKRRYRAALQRFTPFFEEGLEQSSLDSDLSGHATQMAVGGAVSIISQEVLAGRTPEVAGALPATVFATLLPILGPERANEAMERSEKG